MVASHPCLVLATALLAAAASAQAAPRPDFAGDIAPLLAEHCGDCHGPDRQKGGMRFDTLDPAMSTLTAAAAWRKAFERVRDDAMPPADSEPLPPAAKDRLLRWLDAALAVAAEAHAAERGQLLRRLTREQYTNTLQDLLGVHVDFGRALPADAKSKSGFSNNGEALQASALHLDCFQRIARAAVADAIVDGPPPAVTRYRVTFGTGIGEGRVAAEVGGYQSVPLPRTDFRIDVLDRAGETIAAPDELLRRIGVGLRGSGQDRFRVVDDGITLLSALPHREVAPGSWQGPSPNLKLELQRCWPERGDFVLRVVASRARVPALREDLLLALDGARPLCALAADGAPLPPDGAIVLDAAASRDRDNVRLDDGELVAIDAPKAARARLAFDLPHDGFWQVDLVHRPAPRERMPSVRLTIAGHHLDQRPAATGDALQAPRVVTALGAAGLRKGRHELQLGGPFFVGFSHVVITAMADDHPLVQRLRRRADEQDAAVADLRPVIRPYVGTRTDDGMTYRTFGEPVEVDAPADAPATYTFCGRLEDMPIPEPESGDTEILSGFLLVGLWNDHLVKSPQQTGPPLSVRAIEFEAPWVPEWPPASHRAILFDSPDSADEDAYAVQVLTRFLGRAFRRPATAAEVDRYVGFWRAIRPEFPSFAASLREVLVAVLCSPGFLYLVEPVDAADAAGGAAALPAFALASRLSYFLWNSPPDAALLAHAAAGSLPDRLAAEADRLLDDPRSQRFVRAFTRDWLDLDRHAAVTIDADAFPDYTRFVKRDMQEETWRFVDRVMREDLGVAALIDSDWAMLNQNLAEFYGVPGVRGPAFRPVPVTPAMHRGGLLSQGSFLAGGSNGFEPHAIKRAVWLRSRILGDPPPPPPPNVPKLEPQRPGAAGLSLQQRLAAHRDSSSCRDCHAGIDPFGLPFEEFDAVGRHGATRAGKPVENASVLPDGTAITGTAELQRWLAGRQLDAVGRAVIRRLLAHALGRDLDFADAPAVDAIAMRTRADGYRLRGVIRSIVLSPVFKGR